MTPYPQKISALVEVELRQEALDKQSPSFRPAEAFPDFHSRMRSSGMGILRADIGAFILSFLGGAAFVMARQGFKDQSYEWWNVISLQQFITFLVTGVAALLWLESRGHYRQRLPFWEFTRHVLSVAGMGFVASGFLAFASHDNSSRLWTAFCWILFVFFSFLGRASVRHRQQRQGLWNIPAIVIGGGPTAKAALRTLEQDKHLGFEIVDQLPSFVLSEMHKTHAWKQILMMHDAQYIFLALEGSEIERYQKALRSLPRARVPCSIVPPWLGLPTSTMTSHHFLMQDVMLLHDTNRLLLPIPRMIKRMVDLMIAGTALFFLLPFFAAVAIIIRRDGGPVFFKQPRVGRHGRLFNCYKFRSMGADAEAVLYRYLKENPEAEQEWQQNQKLKNDVRITKFGQFIRRTSIDELPQLINVLKGDMSVVGPRPIVEAEIEKYKHDISYYYSVRPGITGSWQVSGRSDLSYEERVSMDGWYVRNWSLWNDFAIICKTIPVVLHRDGAY